MPMQPVGDHDPAGGEQAQPSAQALAREWFVHAPQQRPSQPAVDRPPADAPTEDDRKALDALIGERVR